MFEAFGSGSVLGLAGSVALGFIHPISIVLVVVAVATDVAGVVAGAAAFDVL